MLDLHGHHIAASSELDNPRLVVQLALDHVVVVDGIVSVMRSSVEGGKAGLTTGVQEPHAQIETAAIMRLSCPLPTHPTTRPPGAEGSLAAEEEEEVMSICSLYIGYIEERRCAPLMKQRPRRSCKV